MNDFVDSEGIEEAEGHYEDGYEDGLSESSENMDGITEEAENYYEDSYEDSYEDGFEDGLSEHSENIDDMTENEAFGTYELAFALGLGEEIGLEEAEKYEAARLKSETLHQKDTGPISIKAARAKTESRFSTVSGKQKCPFEQWIKDVCSGRKTVHDPIGGDNSYGKEYDLYAE